MATEMPASPLQRTVSDYFRTFELLMKKVDLAALTADIASNFSSVTERVGLKLIVD